MRTWARRGMARLDAAFASHGVSPEALSLAAMLVSAAAGLVLAAGGAVRDPRLWLLVPPLGVFRLVLDALLDCRRQSSDREGLFHGR